MITTRRLLLRTWDSSDLAPFAALNADARVMRHFPGPMDRAASERLAETIAEHFRTHGFGMYAVEIPGTAPFIGFVGLQHVTFTASFTPCVEIAWRISPEFWGQGYATEAAEAVLAFGFQDLALPEVVALTVPANLASRRVMEKLGMEHDGREDFEHPRLPAEHPLARHVLYRLTAERWRQRWPGATP